MKAPMVCNRYLYLIIMSTLLYAAPVQAHMTAECLTSILKMVMSSSAVSRLYSGRMSGELAGFTPQELNKIDAQLNVALARRGTALSNLVLCCAPGHSRPLPGCDGTLDPNYDDYDME